MRKTNCIVMDWCMLMNESLTVVCLAKKKKKSTWQFLPFFWRRQKRHKWKVWNFECSHKLYKYCCFTLFCCCCFVVIKLLPLKRLKCTGTNVTILDSNLLLRAQVLFHWINTQGSLRMYLWWSLCTLHLHTCQVRVTVGDSGLCCSTCVMYFKH